MNKVRLMGRPLQELASAVGIALLAPLALGLVLDRWLGSAPLMLFVGSSIGTVVGTIAVVRITLRHMRTVAEPVTSADSPEEGSFGKEDRA